MPAGAVAEAGEGAVPVPVTPGVVAEPVVADVPGAGPFASAPAPAAGRSGTLTSMYTAPAELASASTPSAADHFWPSCPSEPK